MAHFAGSYMNVYIIALEKFLMVLPKFKAVSTYHSQIKIFTKRHTSFTFLGGILTNDWVPQPFKRRFIDLKNSFLANAHNTVCIC